MRNYYLNNDYDITDTFCTTYTRSVVVDSKGIVLNSYNSIFSGNEALQNAVSHNINLSYFSFNMFNYTNVFGSLNYSKNIDQIEFDLIPLSSDLLYFNEVSSFLRFKMRDRKKRFAQGM